MFLSPCTPYPNCLSWTSHFCVLKILAWELHRSIVIWALSLVTPDDAWADLETKESPILLGSLGFFRSTAPKAQHLPVACRDAQNPRRHGPIPRPHSLYKVSPRSPPSPSRAPSLRLPAAAAAACLPQPPSPWAEVSSRFRFSSFVRFYCDVCCNRLSE